MCLLLLFLSIASYNAMSFRAALQNNYSFCKQKGQLPGRLLQDENLKCYTIFVQSARIQDSVSSYEQILRIISWTAHLCGLMYIRNRLVKLNKYYNERTVTFGDFSLIIKGLPPNAGMQNTLRKFFREQFSYSFEVAQITLLAEYPQLELLQKQKHHVIKKLKPYYDKSPEVEFDQSGVDLQNSLKNIEDKIYQIAIESKRLADKDQLITQKVICVFNQMKEKQAIRKQFVHKITAEKKREYFGQKSRKVQIITAPEPQQMIWENVNLNSKRRAIRVVISYALSITILIAIFASIFFILQQKSRRLARAINAYNIQGETPEVISDFHLAVAIVYIVLFSIVTFNKTVMAILYHKFTDFERHSTTANFQFSFELKLTFGFFFTTALMTLAIYHIRQKNYYSKIYGVIDQQSIMFFINSFYIPLFWIINPLRIIKNIKRKLNYGKKSFTQRQANSLMEQDQYDMGKKFAQVIETMWFNFMYSTLLPIGAIVTIVGLSCYYWVDKYNLLRRSTVSRHVSGRLIMRSLNLLDFTLFLKPMGSMIFDSYLRNQFVPSSLVMLILGSVYIILPTNYILKQINNQKFRMHEEAYKDVKYTLQNTYNIEHPIVKIVHFDKIKNKLSKKGYILEEEGKDGGVDGSASNLVTFKGFRNFGSEVLAE